MNEIDFPQRLKQWRKENGLTSERAAELLGVSRTTIYYYERGSYIPNYETAYKLAAIMGVNPENIPHVNRCKMVRYNEPLNDEERHFAELNHNLVFAFLNKQNLPEYDWYDVVVLGYLHAVKRWFAKTDLHKYSFSTIAHRAMWSSVINEFRKQKHRPEYGAVSLDEVIPETDGMTYADMLCDPRDCVGI